MLNLQDWATWPELRLLQRLLPVLIHDLRSDLEQVVLISVALNTIKFALVLVLQVVNEVVKDLDLIGLQESSLQPLPAQRHPKNNIRGIWIILAWLLRQLNDSALRLLFLGFLWLNEFLLLLLLPWHIALGVRGLEVVAATVHVMTEVNWLVRDYFSDVVLGWVFSQKLIDCRLGDIGRDTSRSRSHLESIALHSTVRILLSVYVYWKDACILKQLDLPVPWLLLSLYLEETGVFLEALEHLLRIYQHILNDTVHY